MTLVLLILLLLILMGGGGYSYACRDTCGPWPAGLFGLLVTILVIFLFLRLLGLA